jgi:integrase
LAHSKSPATITDAVPIEDLLAEAKAAAWNSIPENTRKAYQSDWRDFESFCRLRNLSSLPAQPEYVCAYLAARARTHKTSSIRRRLTIIGKVHRIKGVVNPLDDIRVKQTWRGILRTKTSAEERKAPILLKDLQRISAGLGNDLASVRDRAIILLGFAGAMRRSELVSLDVSNTEIGDEGLVVHVRRSKTDQVGVGRKIGIPYGENPLTCPVKALVEWLSEAQISEGALFRKVNKHGRTEGKRLSGHSVALIVKRALKLIGKGSQSFSAHSLRAGLATQAAMAGASERSIQNQTGHRSLKVLRTYIRDGNLFRENAAKKAGL